MLSTCSQNGLLGQVSGCYTPPEGRCRNSGNSNGRDLLQILYAQPDTGRPRIIIHWSIDEVAMQLSADKVDTDLDVLSPERWHAELVACRTQEQERQTQVRNGGMSHSRACSKGQKHVREIGMTLFNTVCLPTDLHHT